MVTFPDDRKQNPDKPASKKTFSKLPGNRAAWPRHSLTDPLTLCMRGIHILRRARPRDVCALPLHQLGLLVRVESRKQIKHLTSVCYAQKSKLVGHDLVRTKDCRIRHLLKQRPKLVNRHRFEFRYVIVSAIADQFNRHLPQRSDAI